MTDGDTILTGGSLVLPDGVRTGGWLRVRGRRITELGDGAPPPGTAIDVGGRWVLPGFVDMHVHGGGGASFTAGDAEQAYRVARFHGTHGTTSMLASLVTAEGAELTRQCEVLAAVAGSGDGPIAGIHLEGPFLSKARCGAQDPRYLRDPDPAALDTMLTAAGGRVRMVTVAPELPGGPELIDVLVAAGVTAAVGHTDATFEVARQAFDAGATVATHLFNGMRGLHHREPGPVAAALAADAVVEVINDGIHLHPAAIALARAAAGPDRLALVTDAMGAAGVGDGRYRLGPVEVEVSGGVARLAGGGSIAGSTLTMDDALRRAVRDVGLPIEEASRAASGTPARAIGIAGRTGELRAGLDADLVVLDADLRVGAVMARGEWLVAP